MVEAGTPSPQADIAASGVTESATAFGLTPTM